MNVVQVTPQDWASLSANAHESVFAEKRPAEWDRIDYALLAVNDANVPVAYVTCQERDSKTVYWQFGGAFPSVRGLGTGFSAYLEFVNFARENYEKVYTSIQNTNTAMLKVAMKVGFLICGVKFVNGNVFVEHLLEFKKEE